MWTITTPSKTSASFSDRHSLRLSETRKAYTATVNVYFRWTKLCALDISGRDYLGYALEIPTEKVGTFDTELAEEFWLGFVRNANVTLHFRQLAGKNSHHILEGAFKAAARALRQAVSIDSAYADEIPSTKGLL